MNGYDVALAAYRSVHARYSIARDTYERNTRNRTHNAADDAAFFALRAELQEADAKVDAAVGSC